MAACCRDSTALVFALLAIAGWLCAGERSERGNVVETETIIVIGGEPTPGWPVLPASETEYRFKLKLTGDVISLRWADLEENERRRVQKIYGLEIINGQKTFGSKIQGIRYRLKSGKSVEGLALPERDQSGHKAIRTAGIPLMLIPEVDIVSSDKFEAYESDFFTASDIFQKWLLEARPGSGDAIAHVKLAQRAAGIGLFAKAIDHLQMAAAIDPKMEERNKDFYTRCVEEHSRQRARELYIRLIVAKNGKDYGTAFYIYEQLERGFPNSEFKSRWEALRPELVVGMKADLGKQIVQMCYTVALDLVMQKVSKKLRVDEKNNLILSMFGKQVVTRHGHIFRGLLESGGNGSDMVLMMGNTRLTIKAKEISSVRDVDLSQFKIEGIKEVDPAFDYLKDYVCDTRGPTGLKMQMIAAISQTLRQPESIVQEVFESRLKSEALYDEDGRYTKSPTYAADHEAYYGAGSWLREGSRIAVRAGDDPNNAIGQGNANEDPNYTDDAEIWWKAQSFDTHLNVIRAIAAEKVFKAKEVFKESCSACRGSGQTTLAGNEGNLESQRCSTCRGIGVLFKILYH